MASAWGALKEAGYKKGPGGTWERAAKKRRVNDDAFTLPDEARARSFDLGLNGQIHVYGEEDSQAYYMPGMDHEEYLRAMESAAGIEPEAEVESEDDSTAGDQSETQDKAGLLGCAISAIIGAIMTHSSEIQKSANASILKMDADQRIVWGWAYVSTQDGELLVDSQGDSIEPAEMEKMANSFMEDARVAKAMHDGDQIGDVIHSFPMTNELMKAFGISSNREGWLIAMKIHSDEAWDAVKTGKFTGFSIGGKAADREKY